MKNKLFTLSRRNQKGQVAIFVALIFQVIFIFFAILINVGLLVHHKINLQQSADLAAYYGAMKQAEMMNAISHVNFQMRQAWKLLTWRYRIVGSFGFQAWENRGQAPMSFPLALDFSRSSATRFMNSSAENKCPNGINILDVPFFCIGHGGFVSWLNNNENNCRIDCGHVSESASFIESVPLTVPYDNPWTGGISRSVNEYLKQANTRIEQLCDDLGPRNFVNLARFISAYGTEVQNKKKLIQMLGANLSAGVDRSVDLDGGLIKEGARKTFENNLTEANLSGKISFSTLNGLADEASGCRFSGASTDGQEGNGQFLTEIKFDVVQFFVHQCKTIGSRDVNSKNFLPASIYTDASFQDILSTLFPASMSAGDRANLKNTVLGTEYIVGYEKNPWCQVYYATKAESEPKIPFLPISKIRLSAVAAAKPFGGSIGPRYNAFWPTGEKKSSGGKKIDETLPERKLSGIPPGPLLVRYQSLIPNYANYVGDKKGLKDPWVAGAFEDILLHRQLDKSIDDLRISTRKEPLSGKAGDNRGLQKAEQWPDYSNWDATADPAAPTYDYIALSRTGTNSFLRDLELAVVAPTQFDLAYFSIDPDYYNNYYLKIKGGTAGPVTYTSSYSKLFSAAGNGPRLEEIRPDYGFNDQQLRDSAAEGFSVRHQIAVASQIVKNVNQTAIGSSKPNSEIFKFMPDKVGSLLTGWTFQDFSNYTGESGNNFPKQGPDNQNTMTFGKCHDIEWNDTSETGIERSFDSPVSKSLPPTPGNCVWGGRTGYSVKIISPSLIRSGAEPQDYGGNGGAASILNPIDENFFTF